MNELWKYLKSNFTVRLGFASIVNTIWLTATSLILILFLYTILFSLLIFCLFWSNGRTLCWKAYRIGVLVNRFLNKSVVLLSSDWTDVKSENHLIPDSMVYLNFVSLLFSLHSLIAGENSQQFIWLNINLKRIA